MVDRSATLEAERLFYYLIFMKNTQYISIQGWMVNELKLKGNDLIVYAIIYGFSQDGETEFRGSLKYLMRSTNTTKPTVIKTLQWLASKDYIIKTSLLINKVKFNTYKINEQVVNNILEGSKENSSIGSKETLPNNTIINTLANKKEKFKSSLIEFKDKYDRNMLNDFYSYWTELSKNGKKMRFEGQQFFDVKRRLATWSRNNNKSAGNESAGVFNADNYTD